MARAHNMLGGLVEEARDGPRKNREGVQDICGDTKKKSRERVKNMIYEAVLPGSEYHPWNQE